jgi:molecular chaperone GrpE
MADEIRDTPLVEEDDFTAAAAPHPGAAGSGETSFGDAEAPAPSEGRVDAAEPVEHDLQELVAKARERDEYLALAQRTQADFENFRKRMTREAAQASDRGIGKLAKELLPALDHLELALKAAEAHEEIAKGFAMVRDELQAALARVGVEPFSPEGERFDPEQHEAMAQQPVEGAESGTVVEVYQQGYRLAGAVLRPARVIVAA